MTTESQITYLEEEIAKKQELIFEKEKQADLLKEGIAMDRKLLKIMQDGLDRMKAKTEQK